MKLLRFDSVDAAASVLTGQVVAALRAGLAARGAASLAVPGGRTPVALFRTLRDAAVDWSRVGITLTDERWVPEHDSGSNASLVRGELLAGPAGAARFVPLFTEADADSAASAAAAVWHRLSGLPRPFDAVVLGMGEDGHFASLFPADPGLCAALDTGAQPACVAMRAPAAPVERISMNLAALLQTRRLFLLVTGESKLAVLQAAVQGGSWPVAALLAQPVPLEIYWAP